MGIEAARLPPFEAMRVELAGLRMSPLLMLSPKNRAMLEMLDAYLLATEARLATLEKIVCALDVAVQGVTNAEKKK